MKSYYASNINLIDYHAQLATYCANVPDHGCKPLTKCLDSLFVALAGDICWCWKAIATPALVVDVCAPTTNHLPGLASQNIKANPAVDI